MRFSSSISSSLRRLEQLGHVLLREPHRFILKPALDARAAILSLVEDQVGIRLRFGNHGAIGLTRPPNQLKRPAKPRASPGDAPASEIIAADRSRVRVHLPAGRAGEADERRIRQGIAKIAGEAVGHLAGLFIHLAVKPYEAICASLALRHAHAVCILCVGLRLLKVVSMTSRRKPLR